MREQANDQCSPLRCAWLAAVIAAVLAATGCRNERYSVGTDVLYCPADNVAISPDGDWVPDDQPGIVEGFSFKGCSALPEAESKRCRLPASLLSADVMSPAARRHLDWSDVIQSADLQARLQEKSFRMWIVDRGAAVALRSEVWKDWWLWELPAEPSTSALALRLRASRIATICERAVRSSAGYLTRSNYVCRRSIATPDYAIDYRF